MARYDDRTYRTAPRPRKKKKHGRFTLALLAISCIAALLVFSWYFYADPGGELQGNRDGAAAQSMSVQKIEADVAAANACVMELESGGVIYQKAHEERIAPASTAKLLTALTLLDHCDPEETVTVGTEIWYVAADASRAWLGEGDTLTVRQLLRALLLPSGNDAAYTAAVHTGRKIAGGDTGDEQALEAFVKAMNQKAGSLGAGASHFVTPDGYDAEGQYTTAMDLMLIAKACLGNETVMGIAGAYSACDTWGDGREVTYYNTNELLNPDSPYFYANAIGLKTGSSAAAGSCLVSAAVIDGRTYIAVVMGTGEEERFSDTLSLFGRIESQSRGSAA